MSSTEYQSIHSIAQGGCAGMCERPCVGIDGEVARHADQINQVEMISISVVKH